MLTKTKVEDIVSIIVAINRRKKMTNYYNQVILILRENGMTQLGQVGKDILAHMVLEKIQNPEATYRQICKAVESKNIVKHKDASMQRQNIISKCKGLSDEECAVLYLIEGLELHDYEEDGRKIIKAYIDKIYAKFQKSVYYEEIIQKVRELGLDISDEGVKIMVSMAYKYRVSPKISDEKIYEYLMQKCNPMFIREKIRKVNNIPVEIINGSNLQQPQQPEKEIIKKGIDASIMESAQKSEILSLQPNVKGIMNVILKDF